MRIIPIMTVLLATAGLSAAKDPDPLAILENNCLSCHNAHDAKGDVAFESGPIPDKIAKSIVKAIAGSDPEMPKDRDALTSGQVEVIKNWVADGATIPEGRVLKDTYVPGRDWWSLQPIEKSEVPHAGKWSENEIDAFVLTKLQEKGLSPSPEAPPRVLVRRLYYDLTGLPPTPEEVDTFVAEYKANPEGTWSRLVDRLLASPAYGEHFARHWLDVARYGESHGYDKDKPRPNAWPYRDYVIRSFNDDKPWSQFVKEQIAGDVLYPDSPDGIVALGFIAAGPWDFIAHFEVGEGKVDGRIAKHMDRDDMVSATFNAFMSTTVQCAQCHNHKFDPVSMEDYYRLHAVFAAVDRAPRIYDLDPAMLKKREDLTRAIAEVQKEVKQLDSEVKAAGGPELENTLKKIEELNKAGAGKVKKSAAYGYHSQIAKKPDTEKWVQLELIDEVAIDRIELVGAHDEYGGIGAGFGFPVRYRVEVSATGNFEKDKRMLADHSAADFVNPGIQPVEVKGDGGPARFVRITATKLAARTSDYMLTLGELRVFDGADRNVAGKGIVTALDSIEAQVRWSRSNLIDGEAPVAGDPKQAQELVDLKKRKAEILAAINTPEREKKRADLETKLGNLQTELKKVPEGKMVYAASTQFKPFGKVLPTDGKPREIRLLHRGDIRSPGDVMPAGAPALWEGTTEAFSLEKNATEGDRRAALAEYFADPDNPLLWRSIANRVWLWHFGRGIVDSPNDMGRMGMEPTHPALLDWLAATLRDDPKQSLKNLHYQIVTSATWKQASNHRADMAEVDANNAYYWRGNRRRLSAEELRDSVLAVSGKLNREMGGPSFQDFVIEKPQHSPHYQYHLHDHDDPKSQRRSIYRMIVRSKTQPFMTTLDCADPSQMVAKRDETTTALQALALLNNPFMETMSGHFATRVGQQKDPIQKAFLLVTGREPNADELDELNAYTRLYGLKNTCRILFNLSEFAYVD
ncbi:MAG: cytochrome C [Verrucomicrobiales bacterium]|nr:cytochrome C [Verrucomicrobiales bacterium]